MNFPEDPFKRIRDLAAQADPLRHLRDQLTATGAYGIESVESYLKVIKQHEEFQRQAAVSRQHEEIARARAATKQYENIERLKAMSDRLGILAQQTSGWDSAVGAAGVLKDLNNVHGAQHLLAQYNAAGGGWLSAVRATASIFDPIEDLRKAAGSLSHLEKYAELATSDPFPLLSQVFERSLPAHVRMGHELNDFERLFSSMSDLARVRGEYGDDQFDEDVDLAAPSTILDAADVRMGDLTPATLVQLIEALVRALSTSTNAQDKQIFWVRVYPFLLVVFALLLTPVADHYIKRALADPAPVVAQVEPKQVNLRIRELGLPSMLLSGHRYVDVKSALDVRETARMKARTIGRVPRAEVVQAIQSDGSWTLVRWTDERQTVLLQGWVLSRYLKKFH